MPGSRLLLLSLDAPDLTLLRSGIEEGWLPALSSLASRGRTVPLSGVPPTPGATWFDVHTGTELHDHGVVGAMQLEPGTLRLVPTTAAAAHRPPFWKFVSDAGLSAAVVNAYGMPLLRPFLGVQVRGWGMTHDPHALHEGEGSEPPQVLELLRRRVGEGGPEPREPLTSQRRLERFLARLLEGVALEEGAALLLLRERAPDLLYLTFGHLHTLGHYAWHVHDPRHSDHPGDPGLARAYREIYRRLDRAVGVIVAEAGGADVFLLTPHGMSALELYGDPLPSFLERCGWLRREGGLGGHTARQRLLRMGRSGVRLLPPAIREALARRVPRMRWLGELSLAGVEWGATRAFALQWEGADSMVRINLRARDPEGIVEPGAEYESLCEEIADELLRLVNQETGNPAVESVTRLVARGPAPDVLPDLAVRWRDGPLRRMSSPRVGDLTVPLARRQTGRHTGEGFLIGVGPGIEPGRAATAASVRDVAPTILARLRVPVPDHLPGRPIASLTG